MNEPKRRGRPPKVQPAVEGADVIETLPVAEPVAVPAAEPIPNAFAQAFAKAVWDAQCPTEPRAWRLERVGVAMAHRGYSMEGIVL